MHVKHLAYAQRKCSFNKFYLEVEEKEEEKRGKIKLDRGKGAVAKPGE